MAKANYGIDAPPVVRNLLAAGALGVAFGLWGMAGGPRWLGWLLWPGLAWLVTGTWMVIGSKVLKLRLRDRLLDAVGFEGAERVLDVGCGRGLLLVGAAKRAPRGVAVGLDLWRSVDQSGNDAATTRANAAAEGVAIELETGDMTKMPFGDSTFDVVVSSWAIHNVPTAAGRTAALSEIARVVRPGGKIAILDIPPGYSYAAVLRNAGLANVESSFASFLFLTPTFRIVARKAPT
jgi:SAM-dependent methyltransferase